MCKLAAVLMSAIFVVGLSGCAGLGVGPASHWTVLAHETFHSKNAPNVHFVPVDPGVKCTVENGECRLTGTTQTGGWPKLRFEIPVVGDVGIKTEISCAFRLEGFKDYQLVSVGAHTDNPDAGSCPLILFFEGRQGQGSYCIQTELLKLPCSLLSGSMRREGFGDEATTFHTMKVTFDHQRSEIEYCVDEEVIGVLKVEGDIGAIKNIYADVETPNPGTTLDVRIKDPQVRTWGVRR